MTEREALVALNMIRDIGPVLSRRLIKHYGSAAKALNATVDTLKRVSGISERLARHITKWESTLDLGKELSLIEEQGVNLVSLFDKDYPVNLKEIYDPPLLLYVKGTLLEQDKYSIAMVGSRRPSNYGTQTASKLSRQLVSYGFTIVSGMARGIDTACHRGALAGKGRTIAVFGCGLSKVYPRENLPLSEDIMHSGALISELPMEAVPDRYNFPRRNRIISGLSLGVTIVEAAQRSGSLITAGLALEQGRLVFSVPGRIDSYSSRGTNDLIKQGAKIVITVDDILEEFEYLCAQKGKTLDDTKQSQLQPVLNQAEEKVFDLITEEDQSIEEIIQKSKLNSQEVSSVLLILELKRLIKQLPGKVFIRR